MEDFVYLGMLFDIYKDLLSDVNKEYYSLYYEENLTLQEIADLKKVSKSYVGNVIKKTTQKLEEYENILKLYDLKMKLKEISNMTDLDQIRKELNSLNE